MQALEWGFTHLKFFPAVPAGGLAALEEELDAHLRMDITVQNAVAVSGAAFASAMGAQARAYQTLLALSNARLGTWLPKLRANSPTAKFACGFHGKAVAPGGRSCEPGR